MSQDPPADFTSLINDAPRDPLALAEAIAKAYQELKSMAGKQMAGERLNHTLCATALINEVYPDLFPSGKEWKNRAEFFAAAALAMRNALIDHARARLRMKRGGPGAGAEKNSSGASGSGTRVILNFSSIEDLAVDSSNQDPNIVLSIHEAISQLPERDAEIVRHRYYGGLSIAEAAEALGISESTIDKRWQFIRALLSEKLADLRFDR